MSHTILAVTFELDAQRWRDGQLTIPDEVLKILGLEEGDIKLVIEAQGESRMFLTQLRSGHEIYRPDIREYIKAGDRIRVIASRPE